MSPAAALPETELRPDPHFTRGDPVDQHAAHEVLGGQVAEAAIETQQPDLVHARCEQAPGLRSRQQQSWRWIGGREELARQRFETQYDGLDVQRAGTRKRVAHQRLVPEVQAVECADADHTAVRAPGPALDVTKQPAHRFEV